MNTLAIILLSIVFSAFFSGIKVAFVSSNRLRFELDRQQNNFTTRLLTVLYNNPQQFISTLQVGNYIALVVYGLQMAILIDAPLSIVSENPIFIIFFQISIATLIVLFTGVFLPKTLFKVNPNLWLKVFAIPLFLCYILFYSVAKLSTFLALAMLRIFGVKIDRTLIEKTLNRVDLDYWVQESIENNAKTQAIEHEVKIFQNALDFSAVKIRECMVPRTEIIAVEKDTKITALKAKFIETGLSKIIVYKDNMDDVLGYIHSSEMFKSKEQWQKNINPIIVIPETMPASKLLEQFMQQKKNIALIVDEFGGTAGIVTLEDILEEIFGEIEDEHDNNKLIAKKINEQEFILSGRMEIDTINEQFALTIPKTDNYVTVAGYILDYYQNFPKLNTNIKIGGFEFKILRVANNKIELVKLKRIP